VGAAAFVSTAEKGTSARIVGAAAFVSMEDKGASARIARAAAICQHGKRRNKCKDCGGGSSDAVP
jgi:hypothetical protein